MSNDLQQFSDEYRGSFDIGDPAGYWNCNFKIGTKVRYFPLLDDREHYVESRTRSEAWSICEPPRAIVKIEGKAGGVDITHIEVIEG